MKITLRMSFIVLLFILNGCGSSDKNEHIDERGLVDLQSYVNAEAISRNFSYLTPKSETRLSNYNFEPQPEYVEERIMVFNSAPEDADPSQFDIVVELDPSLKTQLSETQLQILNSTSSINGYKSGCLPGYCIYYLVIFDNNNAVVVDNRTDLLALLGEIDRPSELHYIFYTGTSPRYFQEQSDGFLVLTTWSDCGGREGVDLVHIDRSGNSTVREQLVRQETGMIC